MPNPFDFDEIRVAKDAGYFGVIPPVMVRLPGTTPQTAANFTAPFFIASRPFYVIRVTERHEVAGSSTPTLQVKKVPSGTAPGSGTNILGTALSLSSTANTNQFGTLSTVAGVIYLAMGDALSLVSSGTLTNLEGVTVSVLLKAV